MEEDVIDGYGNPFPLKAQELHWLHIKAAMDEHEREQTKPKPSVIDVPVKDKPAGHYNRGSGV